MQTMLTDVQWKQFQEQGYLKLGKIMSDQQLKDLQKRIDDIMTGKAPINYEQLLMQREAGEGYERSGQTHGFKGATLNYRKIENLEFDPLFLAYMQESIFRDICQRVYGDIRIACYRAMFMNKPARHGQTLQYHQDRWKVLDRDPYVTLWTALDPSTKENGCVKVFPGTHKKLINPEHSSGFLNEEQTKQLFDHGEPVELEVEAGEVLLLHNWTVHGSDGNTTDQSRRAFSVCYMDADTVSSKGTTFSVVFGEDAISPETLS